jgi:hypothetical protein
MLTRPIELPAGTPRADGYARHAARAERTVGLILWCVLAIVMVAASQ